MIPTDEAVRMQVRSCLNFRGLFAAVVSAFLMISEMSYEN